MDIAIDFNKVNEGWVSSFIKNTNPVLTFEDKDGNIYDSNGIKIPMFDETTQ